jgi:hypothetical protein
VRSIHIADAFVRAARETIISLQDRGVDSWRLVFEHAATGKENTPMRQTRPIAIEHVVIASNQPYDKVVGALEARLGPAQDWVAIWHSLDVLSLSEQSRAEVPVDSEQAAYVGNKELALVGLNP